MPVNFSGRVPDGLSYREAQIYVLLACGRRVKEIAGAFGLSIKTVSTYRTRVFKKLGFTNLAELILHAAEQGNLIFSKPCADEHQRAKN